MIANSACIVEMWQSEIVFYRITMMCTVIEVLQMVQPVWQDTSFHEDFSEANNTAMCITCIDMHWHTPIWLERRKAKLLKAGARKRGTMQTIG